MEFLSAEQLRAIVPEAYDIVKTENIKCIDSTAAVLTHKKTGARVAVFINEDENKLFSAAFATAPEDDCGTPHIIEHSVLCGSERYPVKDPFMQLVKSSMQTFLNAMTYADKTVYPVASCNDRDFINLSNVYLDAIFAPNIAKHPEIFMQEGWHYEPTADGSIDIGGVVYSEMMGAMSSPDSAVYDGLICALFPDNAYGRNSGGDPDHIPELTYEKFLDFYNRHYHPSNCYITLYGNLDFAERLEYIDREYLSHYEKKSFDCGITEQTKFGKGNVVRKTEHYSVAADEDVCGKAFLSYGAVCADSDDVLECLAYDFLSDILVESPGAPVKNALISAGIGVEVYGGFLNHMNYPAFSVIAKNTDASRADEFLSIINQTLADTVKNGVNRKSLMAAIERSEFHFREGEQGSTPRGLNATLSMLQNWLYSDNDPFAYLRIDELLGKLRELLETDYYEKLVERLIDPEHGALYILEPEAGMNDRKAAELREKLDSFRNSLTDEEYDSLCDVYEGFVQYQDRVETDAELECIPVLSRYDIPREPAPLYIREGSIGDVPCVFHDINTNGIVYLRLMFDISHVTDEKLYLLDIMSDVLGKVDTVSSKYEELLDEVRLNTGGLGFTCDVYRKNDGTFRPLYEINMRVLSEKLERALSLAEEIISETNFGDSRRIREILSELVSGKQRDIVRSGSEFSAARALAYFSEADAFEDLLDGVSAYFSEKALLEAYDETSTQLSEELREICKSVFDKGRLTVSLAADSDIMADAVDSIGKFVTKLHMGKTEEAAKRRPLGRLNEGFMTQSKVQFVAVAGNLKAAGYPYRGEYQILASVLKNDYLYPEIRMKGGAYGYTCAFSVNTGNVCMATYRDPCLKESVDVFKSCGEFIRGVDLTEADINNHIVGTFGRLDRPSGAYVKASRSIGAYMSSRSIDDIRADRHAMLDVTADTLISLADAVDAVTAQNYLCVIGNEEKISENADVFENLVKFS